MRVLIVSLVFILMGFSLLQPNDYPQSQVKVAMLNDYEKEWKNIDSLENKQLPQSALQAVEELYRKVKEDDNQAQIIKCIIYRNKYLIQLEDKDPSQAILRLEKEVAEEESDAPKAVLNSMLGEFYFIYAQSNQYKIRNRTYTVEEPTDIATWSIASLIRRSNELYLESVNQSFEKPEILNDYNAILFSQGERLSFAPDLNSFLLHRVVNHFSNSQSLLTEPVNKYIMDDSRLMHSADDFVKLNIDSQDSLSFKYQALLAHQKLLSYLDSNQRKDELIYADLARLEFVKQHLTDTQKDSLYISQLELLKESNMENAIHSEICFRIARHYRNLGEQYRQNFDSKFKGLNARALAIANEGLATYPESFGASNCKSLIELLNHKELSIQVEQVVEINKPFLVYNRFKNIEKLSYKLYKISREEIVEFSRKRLQDRIVYLNTLDPYKLIDKKLIGVDYDDHGLEYILEGIDAGTYLLIASEDVDINKSELVVHGSFSVSNIAYATQNRDSKLEILVFDRGTGEPIKDAEVEVYESSYRRGKMRYDKIKTIYTDGNGKTNYESKDKSISLVIRKGNDELDLREQHYVYRNHEGGGYTTCNIFTDRNIYRPGQKVYFKGLLLEIDKDGIPEIKASKKVKVILRDANSQIVKESSFRSNEYGTFNGDFDLPNGGLNGAYYLETLIGSDNVSNTSIQVEEYKRPKFEVVIDTLDVNYKLGDTVVVTGLAKMFAGTPLDQVDVKYRVTRETQYPYWSWWRPRPSSPSQEIINGEAMTSNTGTFSFDVPLVPAEQSGYRGSIFNYKIEVDVVDVTGETQSAISYIKASRTSVFASLDLEQEVDLSELNLTKIKTENINGKHVDANGLIIIEKLLSDDQFKVKRYWGDRDTSLIDSLEWMQKVPSYSFENTGAYDELKAEKQILREGFNTGINKQIQLENRLEVGVYRVTTKVGEDENVQYLQVNDFNESEFVNSKLLYHKDLSFSYEPGETAILTLGSGTQPLYVYYEEEREGRVRNSKWIKLDEVKEQKIKISEKDRGGLFVNLHYTLNNRAYSEQIRINVPWSNKDLKLEYTSIRNKIAPGSEEQWEIKITGDKKDKISAELLATMYDASLDQFVGEHKWEHTFYPNRYSRQQWSSVGFSSSYFQHLKYNRAPYARTKLPSYPQLKWFGLNSAIGLYGRGMRNRKVMIRGQSAGSVMAMEDGAPAPARDQSIPEVSEQEMLSLDEVVVTSALNAKAVGVQIESDGDDRVSNGETSKTDPSLVTPRTNLNETVFFFPDIKTDDEGNVTLNFTMNEALTKWKLLTMAHTKDLAFGFAEEEITTFKNLMVFPNAPRFMRQGDKLHFSAKVHNMTDKTINATTKIELIDVVTEQRINSLFAIENENQSVTLAPASSELLSWELEVPQDFSGLVKYRVLATDGTYSDGEESFLPALTNRMLVTETFPMNVKGNETKTFSFDSFKQKSTSKTLTHQNFAIEYTSNPVWYAIQAMPYLMEYEHDCSEQLFNRYFANALSSSVANSHPRIKQVFDSWKATDSDALLSNLSKNQELKSAILAETPWVMAAKSEEEQKQNLGVLFDLNRMSYEQERTMKKLEERQLSDGGFSWFNGGRGNRYITQYIVEGLGHLRKLGVSQDRSEANNILNRAIGFIDNKQTEDYLDLKDRIVNSKRKLDDQTISSLDVHYLYARSYFLDDYKISDKEVYNYYLSQAEEYWTEFSIYEQAMICLVLSRNGKSEAGLDIIKSLKERSIVNEELGRYWKTASGYSWNQHPIETQGLMIELFSELGEEQTLIDELRIWLLKNKQTNSWKTTKATASAIYALMINKDQSSNSWLINNQQVEISFGDTNVKVGFDKAEEGTLYVKKSFGKSEISDQLADIKVKNNNEVISWGSAYWQYFENLDNIKTFEDTPLQLKKQLYIEEITDTGSQLIAVNDENQIEQGDKVKVRIELRVDRPMEFIHMKDMRASGLEPINVISQYKWQDGLGYYESTKDAATHFFFSYLPKGTYVFEYPLRATHIGEFSNGITTIQSMYAPEFSSHSEGVQVKVN